MKKMLLAVFMLLYLCRSSYAQAHDEYKPVLKKMLQEAGTEMTFKVVIKQMVNMFRQQKSNVPEKVWNEFEAEFSSTSLDELVDMLTPVYQKHFTLSDLNALIAFYQTPVGKKLAWETPAVMQESMQVGQQWGKQLGEKFTEKMKAKGY